MGLDGSAIILALPQGVDKSGQARAFGVAPEQIGSADLAAGQTHRGPRHRRLAQIKARALPRDAPAQHDKARLRPTQFGRLRRIGQAGEAAPDLGARRPGENGHQPLAPNCRVFLALWMIWHHFPCLANRRSNSEPAPF